jgi:tetratricopeptide (TPR) repeat protein
MNDKMKEQFETLMKCGDDCLDTKKFLIAGEFFAKAEILNPQSIRVAAKIEIASLYRKARKLGTTEKANNKRKLAALLNKGTNTFLHNMDEALNYFEEALTLSSTCEPAIDYAARILNIKCSRSIHAKSYDEALAYSKKILDLDPFNDYAAKFRAQVTDTLNQQAIAYVDAKNYGDALKCLGRILPHYKTPPEWLVNNTAHVLALIPPSSAPISHTSSTEFSSPAVSRPSHFFMPADELARKRERVEVLINKAKSESGVVKRQKP